MDHFSADIWTFFQIHRTVFPLTYGHFFQNNTIIFPRPFRDDQCMKLVYQPYVDNDQGPWDRALKEGLEAKMFDYPQNSEEVRFPEFRPFWR